MILNLKEGVYIKPVGIKGTLEIVIVYGDDETIYKTNVKQEIIKLYDLDIKEFNSIIFDFYTLVLDLSVCNNLNDTTRILNGFKKQWKKTYKELREWNLLVATLIASVMRESIDNDTEELMFSTDGKKQTEIINKYATHILAAFMDIGYVQYDIVEFLNNFHQNKIEAQLLDEDFNSLTLDTIIYLDENKKSIVQYYIPDICKFAQYLCMRFIEYDIPLCKCEYCGRYFIPKKRDAAKYCSRIDANGKSCKTLGAKAKHKEKVNSDDVLKTFERTRDKLYKRFDRLEMPIEEYDAWFSKAIQAKKDYQDKMISADEAMKIIFHE